MLHSVQNPISICLVLATTLFSSSNSAFAEAPDSQVSGEASRRLERMKARAAATEISVLKNGTSHRAEMQKTPVFRYDDQPRRILDGTLWAWGQSGRPVALCKVEDYISNEGNRLWVQCLTSLSSERISAKWEDGREWTATESGLKLRQLSKGPSPRANSRLRLTQFRQIARRFSATLIDPRHDDRQEMRLLPQPVCRYKDQESHLIDGAIFGLASNGTNPDACLVLEIRETGGGEFVWEFGVAAMTAHAIEVKLDEDIVWSKQFTGNPNDYDNWMFFSVVQE
jgi:hypothetical protein